MNVYKGINRSIYKKLNEYIIRTISSNEQTKSAPTQ